MAQQTINIGTSPNDGTGDPLRNAFNKANLNFTELYAMPSGADNYVDNFSGDGSTVAFTLSNSVANENDTNIYISGVYQSKDNYTVSGTTLTFSTAPPNGTSVEVMSSIK